MMVHKPKGRLTYREWVSDQHGTRVKRSTGTADPRTANDVRDFIRTMRRRRRWDVLNPIVSGTLALAKAFDADRLGVLDELVAALHDIDLSPLVSEWSGGRSGSAVKYLAQVRCLIPEGKRFPRSQFTRGNVSRFLDGLEVSDPTRNRYRAALSQFGKWLVRRDLIDTNPVRDAETYSERDPRTNWWPWKDARKVADAMHEPYRSLILVMAGTGMEISAALRLTTADVDQSEQTIRAKGSKTQHRNRTVRAEPWAWQALLTRIGDSIGNAQIFPDVTEYRALHAFKRGQKAVALSGHVLHDLRHTYAVNALKAGRKDQVVAHQLGHKDASMVRRVYGKYIPDAADYEPVGRDLGTTAKKLREVKRAK